MCRFLSILLTPIWYVVVPLARLALGILVVLLALAAIGMALNGDWGPFALACFALGALRWLRAELLYRL